MKEKDELEKLLSEAGNESSKFFSDFPHENLNKKVFLKLENGGGKSRSSVSFGCRLTATISACFVFLAVMLFIYRGDTGLKNKRAVSMGEPVSQQMISLDKEELYQWLNFFRINKPDQVDNNLLAVIWKSEGGGYEMAYSSLFENSNRPRPAEMLAFPDNQPSMVVISSQNDDKKYIHYRVLGYKEDEILAFMEQNYVVGGEIEVIGGLIKETRLVPNHYVEGGSSNELRPVVTYYILYQADKSGAIIPSIENIKLNKGEHIAIVVDESLPIEVLDSRLLADWEAGSKIINAKNNIIFLYAQNPGQEDLYIKGLNGGKSKRITVEVVEE